MKPFANVTVIGVKELGDGEASPSFGGPCPNEVIVAQSEKLVIAESYQSAMIDFTIEHGAELKRAKALGDVSVVGIEARATNI
jgi:hypothetical protein